MKKVPRKFWSIFIIGTLCLPVSEVLNRYFALSDMVLGIIQGVGIGLIVVFIISISKGKRHQRKVG